MLKIIIALFFLGTSLFAALGEAGSMRESFQAMVKVELIKSDNSSVTILDGTKFIELKTDTNETGIGASLEANRPADGTYKEVKITVYKFKHKLKVVSGSTTYYTIEQEIANGVSWNLSTVESEYGYTTTNAPDGGYVTTVAFPKSLVLESSSDATLVWINQYLPNSLSYETSSTIAASTWIDETTKATAFLPALPSKVLFFVVSYKDGSTTLTNGVTAFVDADGDLLGAYMARPDVNVALNGSFLTQGENNGNNFSFRFQNGNDNDDNIEGDDYYDINATLNCADSTYSTYSNLTVSEVQNGTTATLLPSYTLDENGDLNCTSLDIN